MGKTLEIDDSWESIRHKTIDELVTFTKLSRGSAFHLNGFTTPEKYPFVVIVAIASPGNEVAVELATEFHEKMMAKAKWVAQAENPKVSP